MEEIDLTNNPSVKVQYLCMSVCSGALLALSFEHLLAWTYEIQQAYMKDSDPNYIKKGEEQS